MILSARQGRDVTGQHLAQAREERVGKIPRVMEDGGDTGSIKAEEKAVPKGRAKATHIVKRENRVYSVLRLGQAADIGLPVVVGDGRNFLVKYLS